MFAVSVIIKDNEFGLLIRNNKEQAPPGDYVVQSDDVVIWFDNIRAMRAFNDSLAILILGAQGVRMATIPEPSGPETLN